MYLCVERTCAYHDIFDTVAHLSISQEYNETFVHASYSCFTTQCSLTLFDMCINIKQNPVGLVIQFVTFHRVAQNKAITQLSNFEWFPGPGHQQCNLGCLVSALLLEMFSSRLSINLNNILLQSFHKV